MHQNMCILHQAKNRRYSLVSESPFHRKCGARQRNKLKAMTDGSGCSRYPVNVEFVMKLTWCRQVIGMN